MSGMTGRKVSAASPARPPLVRAWIAVALIPVFFVLALVVGQVLYTVLGYLPENTVPLWVDLVASTGALVVFLLPCAAAVLYGSRAKRSGDRRGLVPLAVATLSGFAMLLLTVITVASAPHL